MLGSFRNVGDESDSFIHVVSMISVYTLGFVSAKQHIRGKDKVFFEKLGKSDTFRSVELIQQNRNLRTIDSIAHRERGNDMINKLIALLFGAMLLWTSIACAADPGQVDVTLHAFQVVAAQGGKLVPITEARPGDVIEYQVTYRNSGHTTARQVGATLPVPPGGMAYLDGSASPGAFQVSLDGVHYATPPLKREVLRDGRRVIETVAPAEYRFLRWNLGDLAAGQALTVGARMRLASTPDKPS